MAVQGLVGALKPQFHLVAAFPEQVGGQLDVLISYRGPECFTVELRFRLHVALEIKQQGAGAGEIESEFKFALDRLRQRIRNIEFQIICRILNLCLALPGKRGAHAILLSQRAKHGNKGSYQGEKSHFPEAFVSPFPASMPQAAMMSSPRDARIVAVTPRLLRWLRNISILSSEQG